MFTMCTKCVEDFLRKGGNETWFCQIIKSSLQKDHVSS